MPLAINDKETNVTDRYRIYDKFLARVKGFAIFAYMLVSGSCITQLNHFKQWEVSVVVGSILYGDMWIVSFCASFESGIDEPAT